MSEQGKVLNPFSGEVSDITQELSAKLGADDTEGLRYVAPPLVDLVAYPQEPGNEHRETLEELARAAQIGGVGLVGLMPDVTPVADHDGVVRTLRDGAATAETGVEFIPHGALSVGLGHEDIAPMGELKAAGVRMVTDGGQPIKNTGFMRRVLEYARNFDLPVLMRPMDPYLSAGGLAPEGPIATRFGLPPVPDASERLGVLRAGEMALLTGAEVVLFPVVTEQGLDALQAVRSRGARVRAGTALPYLLWNVNHLQSYDGLYRVDPPLSRISDVEALAEAVRNGTIDFVASGHRAVNASEKETELPIAEPGMASMAHIWTLLHQISVEQNIPVMDLVKCMTVGPAKILGLDSWGAQLGVVDSVSPQSAGELKGMARNMPDFGVDNERLRVLWDTTTSRAGIIGATV
ncbi:MAG: hypothetical protein CMH54_02425 [Myxococcales bacterium]|nr:hypothetical protein [Myxococcales bacterium]